MIFSFSSHYLLFLRVPSKWLDYQLARDSSLIVLIIKFMMICFIKKLREWMTRKFFFLNGIHVRKSYAFWGTGTSCLLANLSAIMPKTCSNFVWRSSALAVDPFDPHKNLMWNSVLQMREKKRKMRLIQLSQSLHDYLPKCFFQQRIQSTLVVHNYFGILSI